VKPDQPVLFAANSAPTPGRDLEFVQHERCCSVVVDSVPKALGRPATKHFSLTLVDLSIYGGGLGDVWAPKLDATVVRLLEYSEMPIKHPGREVNL
jgi:hypothetical protein